MSKVVLKCVEIDGFWRQLAFPSQMAVNKFLDAIEGAVVVDSRWIGGETVVVKEENRNGVRITPRTILTEAEYEELKAAEEAEKARKEAIAASQAERVEAEELEDTDSQESASESEDCCGESDCICNAAPPVQPVEEEQESGQTEVPLPDEPEDVQVYPTLV